MALLDVRDVSVRFGGVQALDAVTFAVDAGSVTGLIGPNGAGKTTLFNVVNGLQVPNSGRVVLDDKDITNTRPHKRARLGMARTFQRLETFGTLSVRDNVLVAAEMRRGWSRDRSSPRTVTGELIEQVGLASVQNDRVDTLPTGTARLVEVARALATRPRLLLLDEPSAGLAPVVVQQVFDLVRRIGGEGYTVLIVEQNVQQVLRVVDRAYLLETGRIKAAGAAADLLASDDIRRAYIGL
jgi:branched-chain amino acid transport system ATP-binding protein